MMLKPPEKAEYMLMSYSLYLLMMLRSTVQKRLLQVDVLVLYITSFSLHWLEAYGYSPLQFFCRQ